MYEMPNFLLSEFTFHSPNIHCHIIVYISCKYGADIIKCTIFVLS